MMVSKEGSVQELVSLAVHTLGKGSLSHCFFCSEIKSLEVLSHKQIGVSTKCIKVFLFPRILKPNVLNLNILQIRDS